MEAASSRRPSQLSVVDATPPAPEHGPLSRRSRALRRRLYLGPRLVPLPRLIFQTRSQPLRAAHRRPNLRLRHKFSDMDGEDDGMEEPEEYRRVVSKTSRSAEEGFQFYNYYVDAPGYGSGGFTHALKKESVHWRTLKDNSKVSCSLWILSSLEVDLSAVACEWFMNDFQDHHNHRLSKHGESAYLYSPVRMTDDQTADAVEYGIGGLPMHQIMSVMEHQAQTAYLHSVLSAFLRNCNIQVLVLTFPYKTGSNILLP